MNETESPPMPWQMPFRRTDMRVHELDGEALVYDPVSADTHRLNQTALFIWRQCDGRKDIRRIAKRLTTDYDVSFAVALAHVQRVLKDFQDRSLIAATDTTQS